jgi:hypothetical protein
MGPDTTMVSSEDIVLPQTIESVGGSMVSFWNVGCVSVENLFRYLATLDKETIKQCERVWKRADGIEVKMIGNEPIGSPILSNLDVRWDYQEEKRKEWEKYWYFPKE